MPARSLSIRFLLLSVITAVCVSPPRPAHAARCAVRAVNNCGDRALRRHPVVIPVAALPQQFHDGAITVTADGDPVTCQVDDLDGDGILDELVFLADLPPAGERVFTLAAGKPRSADTDLAVVDDGKRFENARITCRPGHKKKHMVVVDRTTGRHLLDDFGFGAGGKPAATRVAARGPVRVVYDRRYAAGKGMTVTERYLLYAGQYGFELRLVVANSTPGAQPLPDRIADRKLVVGTQGELLTEDWGQVEIISVNWYRTTRHNLLWINPATGHAMGITGHEHWEKYGPTLWITPVHKTPEGRVMHARPMHQWLVPGEDLAEVRARAARSRMADGAIRFGGVGRVPPRKHPPFRHTWKGAGVQTVPAGGAKTFGLSVRFYQTDDPVQAIEAFEDDELVAAGAVAAYGPGGEILGRPAAPLYLDERFDTAARWLRDDGVDVTVQDGRAVITAAKPGTGIRAPFCRDFIDVTAVRATVATLSPKTALKITLEDTAGRRRTLGTVTETGEASFPVAAAAEKKKKAQSPPGGDIDPRGFVHGTLRLELVGHGNRPAGTPLSATLDAVAVAWPTPPPPRLVSPAADSTITAVALSVALESKTPARSDKAYEYQVAADPGFRKVVTGECRPCRMRVAGSHHYGRTYIPPAVLAPGTWYVRGRSIAPLDVPGAWTPPRTFHVEDRTVAPRPPVYEIAHNKPFFFTSARRPRDFEGFWKSLPEKLRPRYGCQVGYKYARDENRFAHFLKGGYPIVLVFKGSRPADTAMLDRLYREHPQVVGFAFGEAGLPIRSLERGILLSGSFGRTAGNFGDLNQIRIGLDKRVYEILEDYGDYFWPMPKSMRPKVVGQRYSLCLGLWLSGRISRWGIETEWWAPNKIGIADEEMRGVDWMPPFLAGLIGGAQVWRIESFYPGKICNIWDAEKKRAGPAWARALRPFFIDVIEHELIPTRRQVLAKTPVVFLAKREYHDTVYRGPPHWPSAAFAALHGTAAGSRQWLPETARYFIVPMLPVRATAAEKAVFTSVVDVEEYAGTAEIVDHFNRYHPPVDDEAFAVLVGDTGLVHNTGEEERDRETVTDQSYSLAFTRGPVASISGAVGYHNYIIAKQERDRLFLHVNNYREKQTTVTLHGRTAPAVRIEPAGALVKKRVAGAAVTVTVGHAHPVGVTRIYATGG